MSALEFGVASLARRYQELVRSIGGKDRDCHWTIEKRWSYGDPPRYFVVHEGYLFEPYEMGESRGFDRYEDALAEMDGKLRAGVCELLSIERQEATP